MFKYHIVTHLNKAPSKQSCTTNTLRLASWKFAGKLNSQKERGVW